MPRHCKHTTRYDALRRNAISRRSASPPSRICVRRRSSRAALLVALDSGDVRCSRSGPSEYRAGRRSLETSRVNRSGFSLVELLVVEHLGGRRIEVDPGAVRLDRLVLRLRLAGQADLQRGALGRRLAGSGFRVWRRRWWWFRTFSNSVTGRRTSDPIAARNLPRRTGCITTYLGTFILSLAS